MLAVKFDHKKLKEKVQMVPKAEPGTKKKKKKKPWKSELWGTILSFFYYMSTLVNFKISQKELQTSANIEKFQSNNSNKRSTQF